jgi:hypothetical protein
MLAFFSLLIAKEVKFSFLIIGLTCEDIDMCFGYLSKKLKKKKQLYFGRFDEGFHSLTRMTLHFAVDPKDSRF